MVKAKTSFFLELFFSKMFNIAWASTVSYLPVSEFAWSLILFSFFFGISFFRFFPVLSFECWLISTFAFLFVSTKLILIHEAVAFHAVGWFHCCSSISDSWYLVCGNWLLHGCNLSVYLLLPKAKLWIFSNCLCNFFDVTVVIYHCCHVIISSFPQLPASFSQLILDYLSLLMLIFPFLHQHWFHCHLHGTRKISWYYNRYIEICRETSRFNSLQSDERVGLSCCC